WTADAGKDVRIRAQSVDGPRLPTAKIVVEPMRLGLAAGGKVRRAGKVRVGLTHREAGTIGKDPIDRPTVGERSYERADAVQPAAAPGNGQLPIAGQREIVGLVEGA